MKQEKNFLLEELKDKLKESKGFIVTRYQNFSAATSRNFRNAIVKDSLEFEVIKKRLFFKALESLDIKMILEESFGHLGVVFAHEDSFKAAKSICDFSEDNNNVFEVLGGVIDNSIFSKEQIKTIAKLPSMEVLRSEFVGILAAPMANIVGVMQSVLTGILNCFEEKAKKI